VDIFADSPFPGGQAKKKGFKTFWMQPGTENFDVMKRLDEEGYNVVYGKCAKVESMRLL
jgi:predicted CoA-binding protein